MTVKRLTAFSSNRLFGTHLVHADNISIFNTGNEAT